MADRTVCRFAKSFFANPDSVTYVEYAKNKKVECRALARSRVSLAECSPHHAALSLTQHCAFDDQDRLLRFFDECPRYISEVSENADAFAELTAYRESASMVQHIEVFKTKLNLPPTADITQTDLEAAYSACRYVYLRSVHLSSRTAPD